MSKVIASWSRVSSDEQAEHGSSLPEQLEENTATIARRGLLGPVRVYCNTDESALGEQPRPHFERLLRDIRDGKVSALVAKHWQRLTRNAIDFIRLWDAVKASECALYVAGSPVDLRDRSARMGALVQVEGSSIDTMQRLDASAKGRIRLAALGFPSSGGLPFGRFVPILLDGTRRVYRTKADGTPDWQIEAGADDYIRRLAKTYEHVSSWERAVEKVGPWPGDPPGSLKMQATTAARRVSEAGSRWTQKFRIRDNLPEAILDLKNADRITIEGHKAIVVTPVRELLDEGAIARAMAKSADFYAHRAPRQGHVRPALSGFLRCGNCGSALVVRTHQEKSGAVVRVSHHPLTRRDGCPGSFLRYDAIATSVLGGLTYLLRDQKQLRAAVQEAARAMVPDADELKTELEDVRKAIRREERALDEGRRNLLRRLDAAEKEWLDGQLGSIKADIAEKTARAAELENRLQLVAVAPAHLRAVEQTLARFVYRPQPPSLLQSTHEEQREVLRALFGTGSLRLRPSGSKRGGRDTGIFLRWAEDAGERFIQWRACGNVFVVDGNLSLDDLGYPTELRPAAYASTHGCTRARSSSVRSSCTPVRSCSRTTTRRVRPSRRVRTSS